MIVELLLPDIDGVELCRQLRERSDAPILVLSTCRRGRASDRDGLCAAQGAGDKPWHGELRDTGEDGVGTAGQRRGARIRSHTANLRAKLDPGQQRNLIATEIGIGYRFTGRRLGACPPRCAASQLISTQSVCDRPVSVCGLHAPGRMIRSWTLSRYLSLSSASRRCMP
jgi:hypothetical protein